MKMNNGFKSIDYFVYLKRIAREHFKLKINTQSISSSMLSLSLFNGRMAMYKHTSMVCTQSGGYFINAQL